MDVCNAEYFTRNEHGFIFEMSKEVVLPNLYWKSEHLNTQNATCFYQQDTNDVFWLSRIAEKTEIVFKLRKKMAEMKRNCQLRLVLKPLGISNIVSGKKKGRKRCF
ncbi:uncharacterized protein LOC100574684 [Acyrthosiphon pisum]|uniref:Uncharacterized protein n=1 Tax=Acyrthosiphon pisum TaxID=7029 RepID=A0A8R1WC42_ACYPI|nr:uncharacterized protein LOC100574684 [Acyrthosiphon pisum]|eukprot:XP_003247534.1 PREDICTED: uncharacterized protein LOC100574684 [Acyrthosiphon pisum]